MNKNNTKSKTIITITITISNYEGITNMTKSNINKLMKCNYEICVIIIIDQLMMTSFITLHALCGDDLSVKIRKIISSC